MIVELASDSADGSMHEHVQTGVSGVQCDIGSERFSESKEHATSSPCVESWWLPSQSSCRRVQC